MKSIRIGHSPDPDDAFMFYGFASGQVKVPGHEIEHVLRDIQTLNVLGAAEDPLEVTALSLHAFFGLEHRYSLLEVGSSVGRSYGPRVVARVPMGMEELEGKRIAMPGPLTTATLAASALLPDFHAVHMDFTEISDAVLSGEVDAGILIHEGQLIYASQGLHLVVDLGAEFALRHGGLPLPLGVNCVRSDLAPALQKDIAAAYRRSVEIAMTQRAEAVDYSLQFARGLATELADRFVGMYVNEDSMGFSSDVREAIAILREEYVALHEGRAAAAGALA